MWFRSMPKTKIWCCDIYRFYTLNSNHRFTVQSCCMPHHIQYKFFGMCYNYAVFAYLFISLSNWHRTHQIRLFSYDSNTSLCLSRAADRSYNWIYANKKSKMFSNTYECVIGQYLSANKNRPIFLHHTSEFCQAISSADNIGHFLSVVCHWFMGKSSSIINKMEIQATNIITYCIV